MLNKVGLVIPTHMSNKGYQNGSWGPPTTGWIETTLETLYEKCPDSTSISTTIILNSRSTGI